MGNTFEVIGDFFPKKHLNKLKMRFLKPRKVFRVMRMPMLGEEKASSGFQISFVPNGHVSLAAA